MKDKKQAVLSATEKDIRKYIRDKKYVSKARMLAGTTAVMCLLAAFFHANTIVKAGGSSVDFVVTALLVAAAILVLFCFFSGMRTNINKQFQLIARWEEVTGWSAEEFPTSSGLVAGLSKWAMEELASRVRVAHNAFAEQKKAQDAYSTLRMMSVSPGEIPCRKLDIADSGNKLDEANRSARYRNERFLSFWDLVTDKPDEGIGILTGPEWQNPEVFRKKFNEEIVFSEIK